MPIGTDASIKHMLTKKVKKKELEDEAATISRVLEEERQALWTVLRASLAYKLDNWLTLVYPSCSKCSKCSNRFNERTNLLTLGVAPANQDGRTGNKKSGGN